MPSAIATENIFPGAAVAQKGDTASLASPSKLASHIVLSGAPVGGVVTMLAFGTVSMDDWTLAAGSRALMTGVTYYVGVGGKLVTFGGQPIGIATSPNTLSVTIQNQQGSTATTSSTSSSALQTQVNHLQAQLNTLTGTVPKLYAGTKAIDDASNAGTVSGLGITSFAPTKVVATVRIPVGGLVVGAVVVDGTVSKAGFDFVLTGLTDSANYKLDFIMLP